jgi:hypothetical protein
MTTTTDAEARMAELRARVEERRACEEAAWELVIQRAGVSLQDLATTRRTLMDLGYVILDDLCVPPGFNLLSDGEVGSVNAETPQWQHWSTAKTFVEDCQHLGDVLARFA